MLVKLAWILPLLWAAPAMAQPIPDKEAIAETAQKAMAATGARGLAIATIDKGKVVSVQAFGVRNAKGDPLTPQTIMYGASLTKAVFAYSVLRLADEGKVDLDKPIAGMLAKPLPDYGNLDAYGHWGDLAGDERWRTITPRMVLNHSTGFANFHFLEPDGKLRIHFDPGSRYGLFGRGDHAAPVRARQGAGARHRQGGPAARLRSAQDAEQQPGLAPRFRGQSGRWLGTRWQGGAARRARSRPRRGVDGYDDRRPRQFRGGAGFGRGLSKKARAELLRPDLPIRSRSQFPTLGGDAPATEQPAGVASSVGLITFGGPQGPAFFRGGHNDLTGNSLVCLEKSQRCVLIMSNDVRAEAAFPMIVRDILGGTGAPWRWIFGDMKFVWEVAARSRPGAGGTFGQLPTGWLSVRRTTIVDERGSSPATGQLPVGCWMLTKKVLRSGV